MPPGSRKLAAAGNDSTSPPAPASVIARIDMLRVCAENPTRLSSSAGSMRGGSASWITPARRSSVRGANSRATSAWMNQNDSGTSTAIACSERRATGSIPV
jgi:hypothetical protein